MVRCYIDESGNTGGNLIDPTQPYFYSGALIANFDCDAKHPLVMRDIAYACGQQDFHANAIGMERLRPHLSSLQSLIECENLRFYIGRVEKRHLALAKFFDVFFDPAENRAAPWHIYNSIQMRFLMLFNLNPIVSDDTREVFWAALMDGNEVSATEKFKRAIALVEAGLPRLTDERSRKIVGDALAWARDNGEAMQFFSKSKRHRIPHFPNLAAFPDMLAAFDRVAEYHHSSVKEIKHDRQCEVETVLRAWHQLIANARDGEIDVFGERLKIRAVPESSFVIASSKDSAGIQLIDLVLWVKRQQLEKRTLPNEAAAFLDRVERNAEFFDMSMAYTKKRCIELNQQILALPFGPKEESRGLAFLSKIEEGRQVSMRNYAAAKTAR